MNTVKHKISHFFILFPFLWLFTGLFWFANGDKIMVATIIVSIIATLFTYKFDTVKENIYSNKFLWLLLAITAYGVISYHLHGYGSREIRALIASSLFLLFFPKKLVSEKLISALVFIASFGALAIVIWQSEVLDLPRSRWFINAIPYATYCSVITIVALSFLLKADNIKAKLFFTIPLITSLIAVLYTQSRGIWLALLIVISGLLILHFKHTRLSKKAILSLFVVIIAAGSVSSSQLKTRYDQTLGEIQSIESGNLNSSIGLRFQMWQAASLMVKKSPFFGLGDSQLNELKKLHQQGQVSDALIRFNPAHYHNQFIDKMVKNGFVGLILLLATLVYPLKQALTQTDVSRFNIIGIVLVFTIASLTDVPFNHGQILFLFFVLLNTLLNNKTVAQEITQNEKTAC